MLLIYYHGKPSEIAIIKEKVIKVTHSSRTRLFDLEATNIIEFKKVKELDNGNVYKITRVKDGHRNSNQSK